MVPLYGTGCDRLDWDRGSPYWVGQVGLGKGSLQIRWDRMGLGQRDLQIRWDRMGLGQGTFGLFPVPGEQIWYGQRDCTMCLYHIVPYQKSVSKIGLPYQKWVLKIGIHYKI